MHRLAFLFSMLAVVGGCNSDVLGAGTPSDPTTESFAPSLGVDIPSFARTESGVFYRDVRIGTGTDVVAAGDQVTITYAGYLTDGTLFDSRSTPTLTSVNAFIQGFRDGVIGMRAGGIRKIVIPSALAYTWRGRPDANPPIPRNATLVFDVEVFAITKPTTTTQ
jgi:FKBP-type peptidyl-prolyl cis-trans isomerase